MAHYEVTDEHFALIEAILPTNAGKIGHGLVKLAFIERYPRLLTRIPVAS